MTKNKEVDILLKLIEEKTEYTFDQLKGARGNRALTHARRAFCVLSRKLLGLTLMEIGSLINRNHSTVIYAMKQHESEIEIYADYGKVYKDLYDRLEVTYIARTEFNTEYIQARIDILELERNILTKQIDRLKTQLDGMNAGRK